MLLSCALISRFDLLQANTYKNLIHMAGMLPLDPGSMTVVPGGVDVQIQRAFASCEAVAICLSSSMLLAAVGITVFYASSLSKADVKTLRDAVAELLKVRATSQSSVLPVNNKIIDQCEVNRNTARASRARGMLQYYSDNLSRSKNKLQSLTEYWV